mmetsp:Transcript_17781/g.42314  ORF Transcript_17781/g.42314 Transcript_17781/m.42314 type:complete len:269 (-) Transcript_17781:206-1012(-)
MNLPSGLKKAAWMPDGCFNATKFFNVPESQILRTVSQHEVATSFPSGLKSVVLILKWCLRIGGASGKSIVTRTPSFSVSESSCEIRTTGICAFSAASLSPVLGTNNSSSGWLEKMTPTAPHASARSALSPKGTAPRLMRAIAPFNSSALVISESAIAGSARTTRASVIPVHCPNSALLKRKEESPLVTLPRVSKKGLRKKVSVRPLPANKPLPSGEKAVTSQQVPSPTAGACSCLLVAISFNTNPEAPVPKATWVLSGLTETQLMKSK